MRNHHHQPQQQQHKENNNNNNCSNNHNNNYNNNTNNNIGINNNNSSTNRYQFCLHPVMAASATVTNNNTTINNINNNNNSNISSSVTMNNNNLNTTNTINNNNSSSSLSPNSTTTTKTDNLSSTKTILSPTTTKTSLLPPSSCSLLTSSSSLSSSSSSSSSSATSPSSLSLSSAPPSPNSSSLAMSQKSSSQQQQIQTNINDNHDHHHHEQIINNNNSNITNISSSNTSNSLAVLSDSRKSSLISNNNNNSNITAITKSLKENNNFTELMQRSNKRLSPTQESSNMSFSSASVAGSIQDDIGDQCGLTKAGLEEYTMRSNSFYDNPVLYHHQKQSSYAQSEGYHSYVSSSDSTSATPMLDRLRQESELLSRQTSSHHWSQNDLSSLASTSVAASPTSLISRDRDDLSDLGSCTQQHQQHQQQHQQQQHQQQQQQHNNSSESTSSTETLKWLGSMSDVSDVSHATGFSAISESVSTSQLIVHSSRVLTPKRHQSESVLFPSEEPQHPNSRTNLINSTSSSSSSHSQQHSPTIAQHNNSTIIPNHRHSPSYPPIHQTSQSLYRHLNHLNPAGELAKVLSEKTSSQSTLSNCDLSSQKSNISVTISNSEAVVTISPHPPPMTAPKPNPNGCNDLTKNSNNLAASAVCSATGNETNVQQNSPTRSQQYPSSLGMVGHKSVSASMDSLSDIKNPYRNNHRLFPVSTYTEPVHSNTSHFVHHPKPQYSTGLQKPQKDNQPQHQQQQSSPLGGSHTNLHLPPKLSSPNYPQPSWQSVAALINDFERTSDQQQQPTQKYTYLDPNKTHRVPNPALKAFQKNAVQSYFERQQHQQNQQHQHNPSADSPSHKSYSQQQQQMRPSSLQNVNNPNEGIQTVLLRNSLPSNYSTTTGQRPLSEDKNAFSTRNLNSIPNKPPSPAPPPPPPRSRSMMPTLLRRSSSASDYAELRDQFLSASQEKLQSQSIKNISNSEKFSFNDCGMPPPPPPPRGRGSMAPRRTSSASDYAAIRDKVLLQQAAALTHQQLHPHQHANVAPPHQHLGIINYHQHHHHTHGQQQVPHPHHHQHTQQLPAYHAGIPPPVPPPVQDGWVPERPPKNPNLRVPSPDLPPPPPGLELETLIPDEPLPPPPPEILQRQPIVDASMDLMAKPPSPNRRNSFAGASTRKSNFFTRSSSNDANLNKGPPPLVPRKPASIELLQVSRPSVASLNQLHSTKVQPELIRATTISSSTRKRPHNLAVASTISAIQENVALMNNHHSTRQSPTGNSSPLHNLNMKSSPPPPPLMPRMPNVQQQLQQQQIMPTQHQQQQQHIQNNNISSSNTSNQKSRSNSKASYLPRQILEKQTSSDPDHGSYKLTLHSNEDLVSNTKTSSYDILAQAQPKLPNNLPDVLPLGAKLQPTSNTSLNSAPSLRYGSNNNISSSNSPTIQQQQTSSQCYPNYPPQQQRYSTPVLNSFNLSNNGNNNNFTRSQSFDTNNHNTTAQSPNKYMTQSSLDLKRPINNLETTIEEPNNLLDGLSLKDNNSSLSSLSSLSESCNSHDERLNASLNTSNVSNSNQESGNSIFRAELVNTTFANNAANKKSVTRQESLRENIEKITQLQSQLMSAHTTDNALLGSYASSLSPHSNSSRTSQANVIDIPKTQENLEKHDAEKLCVESDTECPPATPTTPPPVEEDLIIRTSAHPSNAGLLKSPKIIEEEHNLDSSILSQLDSSTDSLKLVQRSELILRVNSNTVETASQTDDITDSELKSLSEVSNTKETDTPNRTTLQPRQRLPIEDDCEKISQELAQMLAPNDALIHILYPPGNKTVADYVTNLYNPNVPLRPSKRDVGTSTLTRSNKTKEDLETTNNEKITVELKLSELEITPENCDILKNKVDDLIKHLNNKVRILSKEQTTIDEESAMNDELGNCLLDKLSDKVRPIEASKCRTYISDIGHITGLLLSLSERLARAENNLTTIEENNSEKKSLESKRDRLFEQLTEAKRLKADIDRRGISVVSLLERNLSSDEFADFEYFINMKAKLITDARDIADKIKIGDEIIAALSDTLIQSDC